MGGGEGVLSIELARETVSVLEADFEDLLFIHLRDEHKVVKCLE